MEILVVFFIIFWWSWIPLLILLNLDIIKNKLVNEILISVDIWLAIHWFVVGMGFLFLGIPNALIALKTYVYIPMLIFVLVNIAAFIAYTLYDKFLRNTKSYYMQGWQAFICWVLSVVAVVGTAAFVWLYNMILSAFRSIPPG